jgi:hypothetical protein
MLETSGTSKTMNYTPRLECFPFTGQYYLLIKLAMDLNRFSVNFICMFTQIMWFYVMGLTTPFQIRSYVTTCGARIELVNKYENRKHTQKVILLVIWDY